MNYSDVLTPVYVCGYCSIFNTPYHIGDGVLESVVPNAFDLSTAAYVTVDHDEQRNLGCTADGSLELWEDEVGLAYRLRLQNSWGGLSLARAITNDDLRHASVNFSFRKVEESVVAGVPVDRVVRAAISELSLTARPANPATSAWHSQEDPEALPPRVAEARARWRAGRMAASLRKYNVQARAGTRARPSAALLASIDAALQLPRKGWVGGRR